MKIVPEYVYVREYASESRQTQYRENSWYNITDPINYTPNWLHPDGRIHATKPGEDYKVAAVSPYNPKFHTQIEAGVWPLVDALIQKGYLTCSSCEGHTWDTHARVSLVFPTIESAQEFTNQVKMPLWEIKIKTNREIYNHENNLKTTVDILNQQELKKKVFSYYNQIFQRNYSEYYYVDMYLPKYSGYNFIWNFLTKQPSEKYKKLMQQMIDKIQNELPHSIY
jgi:hypothetical protein